MKQQRGFTLVELIVVIAILGILAATALPRFINTSSQARLAAIDGLIGAIHGAVALCQASHTAAGNPAATTCAMVGNAAVASNTSGIPTNATGGINEALSSHSGFTFNTGTGTDTFNITGNATCAVNYNQSTGVASRGTTSGC